MNGAIGPGGFILGSLLLVAELASAATTALVIVRRRADHLWGAPRAVAISLLATAGMIAIQLVPLALGILTRGTVLVAAALLVLAASRIRPAPGIHRSRFAARSSREPVSWLLAGAGLLLTAAFWLAYLELFSTYHPVSVDALSFHFPGVIRYIQTGTLWQTTQYLPGQAQGNYPQYGDVLLLALALPWHSLAFVRLADPLLLALAALAVYASARELGAPAPTAILASLALVAIRPTLGPALTDVLTDPAFLAGFSAGTLFLLRHWRTAARSDLLLAGAGYGLALGTKWYGLTDVPLVIGGWLVVALASRRPLGQLARTAGALVIVVALTGGVWLVRNLILTGNPVFDYKLKLLGLTVFPAPPNPLRSQLGFTLADYLGDPGVLRRYVWPVFRHDFGLTGGLLVAGVAITVLAGIAERRRGVEPRSWFLAIGAVLCAAAYALTPYSAQGLAGMPVLVNANTRYGAPALLLAAPLVAGLAGRLGRARPLLEVLLLALTIIDLRRYLDTGFGRIALTATLVIAAAGAVAVAAHGRPVPHGPPMRRRRRWELTALALAICGFAAAGYHYQRVLARRPYFPDDPTVDYALAQAAADSRIAITGQWTALGLVPVAPLFGPRMENRVDYIGPYVEHRLQEYARPGPFLAALARARPQLLEVGTGFPPRPDPNEARWAAAAGYRVVSRSARLILMRPPR